MLKSSSLGVGAVSKPGGTLGSEEEAARKEANGVKGPTQVGGGTSWFRKQLLAESSEEEGDDGEVGTDAR